MQSVNSSGAEATNTANTSSRAPFEPEKVRSVTNRLASIYCQQVNAVCKHHAAMARVDQNRSSVLAKHSQTQSRIQRMMREIEDAEDAPRQLQQAKAEKNVLKAQFDGMRAELLETKSSVSPMQQKITRQQTQTTQIEQAIHTLENQFNKLNQIMTTDLPDVDCSSTMEKLEQFFSFVSKLGHDRGQSLRTRLISGCDTELSSGIGEDIAGLLCRHLQGTSAALLACQSVDDFSAAFKDVQSNFVADLNRKLDSQKVRVARMGHVTHAAAYLTATAMLVQLIANAYYSGKENRQNLMGQIMQGVLVCAAYGMVNIFISSSNQQQKSRWANFAERIQLNSRNVFEKTGRQLQSQQSNLTSTEGSLFKQWRASEQDVNGLAVSDAISAFLKYCAKQAPVEKLAEQRGKMLKTLRLSSLDEASEVRAGLSSQIDEKRAQLADLEDQVRQLRVDLKQRKDDVIKLEHELKHGVGKKLLEEMAAIDKKISQRTVKEVDTSRLDELKAKIPPLENRLELLEVEAQNSRQAFHAKLAELNSEVARHQLPDSVIQAARLHVCNQLGLYESMFNVMWNRHVGLSPEQLRARVNGESSSGSLGLPVPGHTEPLGASSYANPALALKALFDVTDAMKKAEISSGFSQTMVTHDVPVGLSAVPPEGNIKTIAATLVEVKPAVPGQQRRLHLTPVTLGNSISLTPEAAEQMHQLNR